VRGSLSLSLAAVEFDDLGLVDGDTLVWVDDHQEESRVCVDDVGLVTLSQVVEDRGL